MSLKHIRQIPYCLRYALGRPQMEHRLYFLTWNLGVLFCFSTSAFLANFHPLLVSAFTEGHTEERKQLEALFICRSGRNNG